MSTSDTIREGLSVARDVLNAAKDNPDVQEAGGELGKTVLTVTKAINNALIPLAAVNFAIDKARHYFTERFEKDLSDLTRDIPLDKLSEPKASLAGPALQGLAFAHEEEDLKNLYLNLLASAMHIEKASNAHPSFVEIIKQIDAEEARLLAKMLVYAQGMAVAEIRKKIGPSKGWTTQYSNLAVLGCVRKSDGTIVVNSRLRFMLDNWQRLGLIRIDYSLHGVGQNVYDWVKQTSVYKDLSLICDTSEELVIQKGVASVTAVGQQFAKAVGI